MLLIFVCSILLFSPLFCHGCMRTPDIPGGPSIPITTLAPITPDPCPIPPATAMIFILNDVSLVDGQYGMVAPAQSCATATGKNAWYTGQTPETPAFTSGGAAGTWSRDACAAPCLCDAGGICYIPSNPNDPADTQNPLISLYPHCPTPTTCFIAAIMQFEGVLTPTNGGIPISSDDQVDMNTLDPKPVTDPLYVKVKSIGCSGCPVVVA